MSSPKLLVVLGATGTQGGSVVKTFKDDPEWRIRGVTRNTSSKASQALSEQGVEMVAGNLDDTHSLVSAFKGAHAIFSVTDFWNPVADPENLKKLKTGQTINEWAYEYEKQQGKNVFDAAAKTQGLQRLVFSSLSDATKWSKGKYRHVYHLDSKAHAVEYGRETYPELWQKTSIIIVGFYLSNYSGLPSMAPKKNSHGTFEFVGQLRGDTAAPFIAPEEDTGPLVKALLAVPPGKNLMAYREWMTMDDFVSTWSRALNVKGARKEVSFHEAVDLFGGPPLGEEFAEMMAYIDEFGAEARDDPTVVHPRDLGVEIKLPTVEEWIKKQDWTTVLNQ